MNLEELEMKVNRLEKKLLDVAKIVLKEKESEVIELDAYEHFNKFQANINTSINVFNGELKGFTMVLLYNTNCGICKKVLNSLRDHIKDESLYENTILLISNSHKYYTNLVNKWEVTNFPSLVLLKDSQKFGVKSGIAASSYIRTMFSV